MRGGGEAGSTEVADPAFTSAITTTVHSTIQQLAPTQRIDRYLCWLSMEVEAGLGGVIYVAC